MFLDSVTFQLGRRVSFGLTLFALLGTAAGAQHLSEKPRHPGMSVVACGDVTIEPSLQIVWEQTPDEMSLKDLVTPEVTLLVSNTTDLPLTAHLELTFDAHGGTVKQQLEPIHVAAEQTVAVPVSLEVGSKAVSARSTGSVSAYLQAFDDTRQDMGRAASTVLYFQAMPDGLFAAFGEGMLRHRLNDGLLPESKALRGVEIPAGVTLEMASVDQTGELRPELEPMDDALMLETEKQHALKNVDAAFAGEIE